MILNCKNLSKSYHVGQDIQTIINDVSFSIDKGYSMAVLGSSGSGKSTLLHIVSGLLKADHGSVKIGKYKQIHDDPKAKVQVNPLCATIYQHHHLFMEMTVLENVMLPLMIRRVRDVKAQAINALMSVGLENMLHYYPNMLSGGQRQRVSIARAVVVKPKLIIADEPTGSLDKVNALKIRDLLYQLQDKFKISLLIATHDMNIADGCDQIFEIHNGLLVEKNKRGQMTTLESKV